MPAFPTGTVTFLFTDMEASTRLLQRLGDRYPEVLEAHRRLIRQAVLEAGGYEFETQGDGLFVAFQSAKAALTAAVGAQRALHAFSWPEDAPVRVRMALHSGHPTVTASGYVGLDLHRTVRICSASHGGQVLLSQPTMHLLGHELPAGVGLRDLGEHRLKNLERPERIFQAVIESVPSEFPPIQSLTAYRHNLPVQMTSFIGREREAAEVKDAVARARLVTLTGAGGCGKTRLAIHVAADLVDAYRDGAWLAELASLSDQALVPQTIAFALGIREEPQRPLIETLLDALQPGARLLVLDNCEHVLAACAELADRLLRVCPSLRILATSREPLRVAGELTYRVPSLPVPDLRRLPAFERLAQSEAVRLFVERATLAWPAFALTPGNAETIARICHRLNGIPLAIELAAVRVKALSVAQIESRLHDSFRLLTGGGRTTLSRHQTLRAAMDWSYDLLSDDERIMLRRVSVFAGGFTLEAAEAVCFGDGDVLDVLTRLIDRSLVIAEESGTDVRYRLLETVRQYGREKLRNAGEAPAVSRKHRDWYMAMAEPAESALRGPTQAMWLERLEAEHDNFRAALEWSLDRGDADAALALGGFLWWFWYVRGYYSEGHRWLQEALRRGAGASLVLRAKALARAGQLVIWQGEFSAALALLHEGLALSRQVGDRLSMAECLYGLGKIAWRQGEFDRAAALYEEARDLFDEIGAEDRMHALLISLGALAVTSGDYEVGRLHFEGALSIARRLGDQRAAAFCISNLGTTIFRQGDVATARALLRESLAIFRELGEKRGIAEDVMAFACIAAAMGPPTRAARLFGAAEALHEAIGVPLSPPERAFYDYERYVSLANAALGPDMLAALSAEGRAMNAEQAVEYTMIDEERADNSVFRPRQASNR